MTAKCDRITYAMDDWFEEDKAEAKQQPEEDNVEAQRARRFAETERQPTERTISCYDICGTMASKKEHSDGECFDRSEGLCYGTLVRCRTRFFLWGT